MIAVSPLARQGQFFMHRFNGKTVIDTTEQARTLAFPFASMLFSTHVHLKSTSSFLPYRNREACDTLPVY